MGETNRSVLVISPKQSSTTVIQITKADNTMGKKHCSHEGCKNNVKKGGFCKWHGAKSVATSPGDVKHHPQPNEGYEATTAGGIARRGGEIGVNNVQTNISSAASRQSPSPRPSVTTPDSYDDEELGDWIYRSWLRTVRSFANSVDEVSSSSP